MKGASRRWSVIGHPRRRADADLLDGLRPRSSRTRRSRRTRRSIPHAPTLDNYSHLFAEKEFGDYPHQLARGDARCRLPCRLVVGTLGAYAIARFRLVFRLERRVGLALLTLRIVPAVVILIPVYLLMLELDLLDTWLGLIITYTALNITFVVWMMESFFREIPVDLEEAAMVDGDSRFTAFRRIVLPLAAPGLVATAIFAVIVTFNEFLFALVLTATPRRDDDAARHGDADRPHRHRLGVDGGGRRARRLADRDLRAFRAAPSRARADARSGQIV